MAIRFLAYAPRSKLSCAARKQKTPQKIARKRPTKLRYSKCAHMSHTNEGGNAGFGVGNRLSIGSFGLGLLLFRLLQLIV